MKFFKKLWTEASDFFCFMSILTICAIMFFSLSYAISLFFTDKRDKKMFSDIPYEICIHDVMLLSKDLSFYKKNKITKQEAIQNIKVYCEVVEECFSLYKEEHIFEAIYDSTDFPLGLFKKVEFNSFKYCDNGKKLDIYSRYNYYLFKKHRR